MVSFIKAGWQSLAGARRDVTKGKKTPAAGMLAHVDRVTRRSASGWAFYRPPNGGPDEAVRVEAWLNGERLAAVEADQSRPDVAEAHSGPAQCGFRMKFDDVPSDQISNITLHAGVGEQAPKALAIDPSAYQRRSKRYQDFDDSGEGSSRSHEKLKALQLQRLGQPGAAKPLAGLSVLDLGCNEGFFCLHALKMGAERVVGVEQSKRVVQAARKRCPEAEFIHGSWWSLPDERFDIILFLSAIHYEPEQKALLQKLKTHLKPGGHLVLECGVASEPGARTWHTVARGDGVFKYPTRDLLVYDLLSDYSVRPQGRSVKQAGDPVNRFIFHCAPKQPTAILISGQSRSGKSNLSFDLIKRDIPTFTTDTMLSRVLSGRRYDWSPVAQVLRKKFGKKGPQNLGRVAEYMVRKRLGEAFAELIAAEVPVEAELFSIQGEALRHQSLCRPLVNRLEARGVRVWIMQPAVDVLSEGRAS